MKTLMLILSFLMAAGCEKKALPQKAQEPEVHTESATNWTAKTELFMEHPPLVAGQTSRFAIHLTRLDNFKAVAQGKVEVQLVKDGRALETFSTDAPSRPGIFGVMNRTLPETSWAAASEPQAKTAASRSRDSRSGLNSALHASRKFVVMQRLKKVVSRSSDSTKLRSHGPLQVSSPAESVLSEKSA